MSTLESWRRELMSDLVSAFDFVNPDLGIPSIPTGTVSHTNADGVYDGAEHCEALYPTQRPRVSYDGAEGSIATDKGHQPL